MNAIAFYLDGQCIGIARSWAAANDFYEEFRIMGLLDGYPDTRRFYSRPIGHLSAAFFDDEWR